MKDSVLRDLLSNAVHFGRKTTKWNPKMASFIYGERQGIHLFDLEKTAACLEAAIQFLQTQVALGKTVLFVGTKPQVELLVKEAAMACDMPYVNQKWIPGLLTNFSTIKERIRSLQTLQMEDSTGGFSKYTKKEATQLKKKIVKLEAAFGGVKTLSRLPDILFVVDSVRESIAVKEAQRLHIPIVALMNTHGDPVVVSYPIPGNDNAMKSLTYLVYAVKDAILDGKKKRKMPSAQPAQVKTSPSAVKTAPKAAAAV